MPRGFGRINDVLVKDIRGVKVRGFHGANLKTENEGKTHPTLPVFVAGGGFVKDCSDLRTFVRSGLFEFQTMRRTDRSRSPRRRR